MVLQERSRLELMEMKSLERMCRVTSLDRMKSKEVRCRVNVRELVTDAVLLKILN